MLDYARRFENLQRELENSLAELRDNAAGRLVIGANESTTLYLLQHIERYRRLYPKVKVQVRRSLSSKIPGAVDRRRPGTGRDQLRSGRRPAGLDRSSTPTTWRSWFRREHRFAERESVSITELGMETFIAHNVISPYREVVLREFQRHKVPLNMDVEMPTVETIRKLVQRNEGVAFLPRMCVEQEIEQGTLVRGEGGGTARGAQDPAGLSGAPRAEPRRQGVPGAGEGAGRATER